MSNPQAQTPAPAPGQPVAAPVPAPQQGQVVPPPSAHIPAGMHATEPIPGVSVTATDKPHRTKDGKLTRAGMEYVVKNGGAVAWGGIHHTTIDTLPTEADLAGDDEEAGKQALAGLDEQQRRIDAEKQKLLAAQGRKAQEKQQQAKPAAAQK